ncbi:MAG: hypothetical protein PHQ75_04390 [Thermoguttaceae bacterium]|nr:hypothetical protein [Thermoguttaceae bacterium]
MKVKNKLLPIIMLVLFGVPGIFAEGLHIVLPGGIGMIYHMVDQSGNHQRNSTSFPQPIQYNPNCPICQFCSMSVVSSFSFVLTAIMVLIGTIVIGTYRRPVCSISKTVFQRGPPEAILF